MSSYLVGEVRPSQLLWAYGPGALIDLPNLSVLTMGLERWNPELCPPIEEARLPRRRSPGARSSSGAVADAPLSEGRRRRPHVRRRQDRGTGPPLSTLAEVRQMRLVGRIRFGPV